MIRKVQERTQGFPLWPCLCLGLILLFVIIVRVRLLSIPLERDEGEEVGPAQWSYQYYDNLPIRGGFRELDYAAERLYRGPLVLGTSAHKPRPALVPRFGLG